MNRFNKYTNEEFAYIKHIIPEIFIGLSEIRGDIELPLTFNFARFLYSLPNYGEKEDIKEKVLEEFLIEFEGWGDIFNNEFSLLDRIHNEKGAPLAYLTGTIDKKTYDKIKAHQVHICDRYSFCHKAGIKEELLEVEWDGDLLRFNEKIESFEEKKKREDKEEERRELWRHKHRT